MGVSDVIACLQVVFAGRCIVCSDRGATNKACRTANRRTRAGVSSRGADGEARRRPKQRADGGAADDRGGARLPWLEIADRSSRVVAALSVFLLEDGEALSL